MTYHFSKDGAVYDQLRALKESFGPSANKRDRATVLIGACILNGFDTRYLILKRLRVTGLSRNHVIDILDDLTGTVPGLHLWRCDDEGRYHPL